MTIFYSSTTQSQESVDRDVEASGDEVVSHSFENASEEQPSSESKALDAVRHLMDPERPPGPSAVSSTDSKEEVRQVQQELDQEREQKTEDYLKGRRSARRRIGELVGERNEARDERDQARAELEAFRQQAQAQPERAPHADEQQPQLSQEEMQAQYRSELQQLENRVSWPYRLEAARNKYGADFDASIKASESHQIPTWALAGIENTANGADVLYFLAKNPSYIDQIRELDGAGQGQQAFGLLSTIANGLATGLVHNQPPAARSQPGRTRTVTPEPIASSMLRGGPSLSQTRDPLRDAGDYQTFKKLRNEQERRGGR